MNETNFDWDDLRLFLAVASAGGLHKAAAETGKSPPTLGRRMVALEQRLGRSLFHRHARGYDLTDDGEDFLHQIKGIESSLHPLISRASTLRVKISAGSWMTQVLCTMASDLTAPGTELHFISAEHHLDIGRREAVIGIRNARPTHPTLAGRMVGHTRFAGYASEPGLPWIKVAAQTPSARWLADQDGPLTVTAPRNALDLALEGHGMALLPVFIGDATHLKKQAEIPELTHEQWLVTHHEDRTLPPVRRVIDKLAERLTALHTAPAST